MRELLRSDEVSSSHVAEEEVHVTSILTCPPPHILLPLLANTPSPMLSLMPPAPSQGQVLLGSMSTLTKTDGFGRLLLRVQDGACRLPDVFITDKNDTFHMETRTYSTFRIMARAVQRDLYGNLALVDAVAPAVSSKITVRFFPPFSGKHGVRVITKM